jgi:hypothetical protein
MEGSLLKERAHMPQSTLGRTIVFSMLLIAAAVGCRANGANPYVSKYKFIPPTQTANLRLDQPYANTAPAATATTTIAGVRNDDADSGIPSSIEVRIRVDNRGPAVVSIDPGSLELLAGAFDTFPPPQTEPSSTLVVQPSESRTLTAYFPFPSGKTYDTTKLKDVRVNYVAKLDGNSFPQTAVFNYLP